ncbi:hypothetical protein NA57DRAFT_54552 [Rhizodiscina lignyota]|uniref:Chorismate synthase protein n=1 Tax=Rhizodiscina lignyota TaxID=1504668 RepID=A0A9P4MAK8_9PEZI|nr:hypothetical protein NA57DRAFT_54552 [Rhizodiscina lignyota]
MEWKGLIYTLGPLLLPKLIGLVLSFYRSFRASSRSSRIRPLPPSAQRALNILFLSTLIFLVLSLPTFAPENIFTLTQSRIQTSTDVVFARLKALRGENGLTDADLALKDRFQTRDGRLLYFQFGPDPLANCPFCATDTPRSFFLYALPAMLIPHLVHLIILGLCTSELVAGPDAARWRSQAAMLGAGLAVVEAAVVGRWDYTANVSATTRLDISHFFWTARTIRYVALAAADLCFSGVIYLSATRRAFVSPHAAPSERVEDITRVVEAHSQKLGALGALRNAVMRDKGLRERLEYYWTQEAMVMAEVGDDAEVVAGLQKAAGTMDLMGVERRAGEIAAGILGGLRGGAVA